MLKKKIVSRIALIGTIGVLLLSGCSSNEQPFETSSQQNETQMSVQNGSSVLAKTNAWNFGSCTEGAVYIPNTGWLTKIKYKIVTLQGVSGLCGTDRYASFNLNQAKTCVQAAISEWNQKLQDYGLIIKFVEDNANAKVTITLGKNVNGSAGTSGGPGKGTDEVFFPPGCYGNSNSFFYNTILHELGHVLGLRHFPAKPSQNLLLCGDQEDPNSVMYTGNSISDGDLCTLMNCLSGM